MNAARPLRWLLALVALFLPATVACSDCGASTGTAAQAEAAADVVFRHYL